MGEIAAILAVQTAMAAIEGQQNNKAAKGQRNVEDARIRRSQEIEARRQKEALKRGQATQRANFGASGLNSSAGSAAAVLGGMGKRVDKKLALDAQEAEYGIAINNAVYKNTKRKNLLALSAPLERMAYGQMQKKLNSVNLLDDNTLPMDKNTVP